jgi:hypothetical protein
MKSYPDKKARLLLIWQLDHWFFAHHSSELYRIIVTNFNFKYFKPDQRYNSHLAIDWSGFFIYNRSPPLKKDTGYYFKKFLKQKEML